MNFNRVSGFASGMDTESIIKDMMTVNRVPLDKLFMKKQTYSWQRDQYRDMNKLLKDLDTTTFDTIGRQATFLGKIVSSTDESAVTATGAGATGNMNSTVEVKQLATASQWMGTSDPKLKGDTLIGDIINPTKSPLVPLQIPIEISVSIPNEKTGELEEKKKTILIDPKKDTIDSLMKKINDSDLGVSALYSSSSGTTALTSKTTGSGGHITIKGGDELFSKLGFGNWPDGKLRGKTDGKNAEFSIDGVKFTERTNNPTVGGMKYTFKKITTEPVRITSQPDIDKSFDAVKKWVDAYNTTIKAVDDKTSEEKYRDYPPLTDAQKKDMSEDQIKKWEEKAASGLLRSDSSLNSALNSMRNSIASDPERVKQLESIGITFSKNYLDKGKLEINEEKLKTALGNDSNAVYEIFNKPNASVEGDQGIVKSVRGTLGDTMKKIEVKAGNSMQGNNQFTIGRNIEDIEKSMKKMEAKLKMVENRLWKQFGAMEQAINKANSQGASIMNAFGG